jgi:predicted MFS family arabinose efflux permease
VLLARADAGLRTATQVATLAGALGGGVLADALGTRSALLAAAALAGTASLLAALTLTQR